MSDNLHNNAVWKWNYYYLNPNLIFTQIQSKYVGSAGREIWCVDDARGIVSDIMFVRGATDRPILLRNVREILKFLVNMAEEYIFYINPLKTKRRLLYLKTQFVPRSKNVSSRL